MSAPRRSTRRLLTTSAFGALALAAVWATPAQAQLVQTGATSNGTAPVVDQSVANSTTVTLNGSRTVIDWSKFDVNSGDTANFVFANRSDIVLNRVNSATSSTINGNLNGTIGSAGGATGGNIWIYNANGVVIGANARISTGGLLVTTAALDRATDSSAGGFLDGSATSFGFTGAGAGNISVQNGAQVTSHGGAIALVAPVVTTEAGSSISAQGGGNVLVGSASKYQISFRPTSTDEMDLLSFEVADGAGTSGSDAISLAGDISGNRVFVAAVSKSGLVASVMNTGTITATTAATDESGAIVLSANHNIVNGAAAATPVSGAGAGFVTTFGGSIAGPKVDFVASENVLLRGDVGETSAIVNLHSDNTDVKQFAGVITADTLSASAHTGINFNSFSANRVDKLGALSTDTGDLAYIGDEDGVEFTGMISAPGKVTLGARGFMDTTTGTISAGSLSLHLGDGGSFKVNGDANIGDVLSNGAVTVRATGDITLANEFAVNLGNTLTLIAGGAIRETTGFISGGGTVIAAATGAIDLGQANQVSGFTATLSGGGNISLRAAGSFGVTGSWTSGTLTAVSDTGGITGTGVDLGQLNASAAGGIDFSDSANVIRALGNVSAGGDAQLTTSSTLVVGGDIQGQTVRVYARGDLRQIAGTISGNDIYLTAGYLAAGGSIDQASTASISTSNFLEAHAGTDLLLRGANNLGYQDPYLTSGSGRNLTIRSVGDYRYNSYGITVGTLTLISDTGSIRQGSGIYADTLIAQAATGLLLDGGGVGNTVNTVGGLSTASGDITFANGINFDLAGNITAPGVVRFGTNGAITWSGGQLSAGTLEVTAGLGATFEAIGNIKLGAISTPGGNFTLATSGDITVAGALSTSGHMLSLYSSDGAIATDGGTVSTGVGLGVVNATAKGAITLVGAGFANFWATSTNGGDIDLSGDSDVGFVVNTSGNVTVTSGGLATGNGDMTAGSIGVTAGTGIFIQDSSASDIGSFRYLRATEGYINVNVHDDIVLDGDVSNGTSDLYTVSLTSTGSIIQNSGSIIASSFDATAATGISLQGSNDIGELNNLSSSSGDILYRTLGDIVAPAITAAGTISLTSDNGSVSQTGALTANTLVVSAGGAITLTNTGNNVAQLGNTTIGGWVARGGDINYVDADGFNLGWLINAGVNALSLTAGGTGSIGQIANGGYIVAHRFNATAGGNITLGNANGITIVGNVHAGGTGDILVHTGSALFLNGTIAAGTGGDVTLTTDVGGITQNGGSITADKLSVSAQGNIVLDRAANAFDRLGAVSSRGGAVTLADSRAFDLTGQVWAAGALSLSSGGAITSSPGGRVVADGLLSVSATSATLVANGNIQLGSVTASGGDFSLTGDGGIDLTGAVSAAAHSVTLGAGGAITRHGGVIAADRVITTAVGGIDLALADAQQSYSGYPIVWATSSGAGNINLSAAGDISFMIDTAGDATVDAIGVAANNDKVIAHALGISAGTGIYLNDQTVTIDVGSYRNLAAANGSIDIENKGNINLDGDVTASTGQGSYLRLHSSQNSILQNSGTITGYSVELDAEQSVLQDINARVVVGGYGLTLRGTDVSMIGANELPSISTYWVSHDLTLRAVGTLDMTWSANQAGTNHYTTLISDTGNIIGGPIFSARLSATATNGSLSFTYGNNQIGSLGDLTAKSTSGTDIEIFTDSTLGLAGNITGGGVILHATQGINQTAGVIAADRLAAGTSGDLLLGGANNFGTLTEVGHGNNREVTIRNHGSILLPSTPTTFGTLTLISDTGSVTQTSGITAATLVAHAATGIGFNSTSNNFTRLAGLATTAGDIRIRDTGSLAIEGDIIAPGTVLLSTTGAMTTGTTTVGSVTTPHGKVDADTLSVVATNATIYAAGDIKLGGVGINSGFTLVADGSIELTDDLTTGGASLIATSGSITQTGGILAGGAVLTGAAGSITLDRNNTINDFGGTSTGGGSVIFNTVNTGTLSLSVNTSGYAEITSAGGVLGSFIRANNLSITAAGAIDLTNNVDVNDVSKLFAGNGDVRLTDNNGFQLTGDVTAGTTSRHTVDLRANSGDIIQSDGAITGDDVHLTATGYLNQTGAGRVDANTVALSGSAVLFGGANSFDSISSSVSVGSLGPLTLRNAGSIDLDALGGFTTGGELTLISDNGSITSLNLLSAASLTVVAERGSVNFANINNNLINLGAVSAAGDAAINTNSLALSLNGNIRVGGRLTITAEGSINQSSGTITADSLYASSNGGSGPITLAGNNDIDRLGDISAAGNVRFNDIDGFQVAGAVSGSEVWLSAAAGAISQGSASTITAGRFIATAVDGLDFGQTNAIATVGSLVNSGTGGINFKSSGAFYNISGDVTAAGQTVTLASANGQIIQNNGTVNAGLLNINSFGYVGLRGGTIDAIGTVQDNYYVSIAGISGDVALTGDIHALGFGLTASGAITQTGGTITTPDLSLSAGSGITALAANNDVDQVRLVTSGAGAIQFNTLGDLKIAHGASNADGLLDIRAGGKITVDQFSTVTANQFALHAGGDIAIDQYADLHIGTVKGLVSDTGDIAFYNYAGFVLDGNLSAAGTVTVRAGIGDINQQSGIITAARLNVRTDNGSITLGKANAVSQLGDAYAGYGNFTFTNAGDLQLDGGVQAPGMVTLTSGGAISETANGSLVGGGLIASAETGIALGRNLFGTVWGLSSTAGGILFSNNGAFDIQGDIDAGTDADVSLTANGGGITGQSAGTITAHTLILNTGGDTDLNQANHVQSLGPVDIGVGYFHFSNAGDIVIGGGLTIGGDLALTSGGAIRQTDTISSSSLSASAVNGIALNYGGNDIASIAGLSNSSSGGITLASNVSYTIDGDITAVGQAVELSGNAAIAQSGGSTITAAQLRAFGYSGLSLTSVTNNVASIIGLGSTGDIAFTNANGFSIDGSIYAAGHQLTLASVTGGIEQSNGTIEVGNVVASAAGAIALGRRNDIGSSVASAFTSSTGDISFHSANAILLGTVSTPGLLSLTTDAGGIAQTVGISAGRLSATTSSTGDIVLDQANAVGTLNDIITNGGFTLNTSGDLTLDGEISAPDLVKLTTDGNITQIGTGGIHSDLLQVTSGAGALNGISLLNHNDVAQAQLDSNGNDLRFRNTGDFALGNINAANHIVEMISDGGAVTQQGGTSIIAGTFLATGTNVDLSNTGNQIARIGLISTGSDLTINNGVSLTIDAIDAGSHDVTINTNGGISGGNITAATLNLIATGNVDLGGDNTIAHLGNISGTDVSLAIGVTDITGAISGTSSVTFSRATSANDFALTMTQGGLISTPVLSLRNGGTAGTATLTNIATPLGALELNLDFNGDATVAALGDLLKLGQVNIDGDLFVRGGQGVSYIGTGADISGTLRATALSGDINLLFGGGTVGHFGTILATSGDIHLGAATVDITGGIQASGGLVELQAASGSVTEEAGGYILANRIEGSAANDFLLGGANQISTMGAITATGGNILLNTDRALTIDADVATDRDRSITLISTLASGPAIQNNVGGVLHTGTLNIQAIGDVVLRNQDILRLGFIDPTLFSFSQAADYDVTSDIVADAVELTSTAGRITQSGGVITADTVALTAQNGIELTGNNHFGSLSLTTLSGDIDINNVGDLVLASLTSPGNARVTVTGGGTLTINGPMVTANGNLSLDAASDINVSAAIDAEGDVSVLSQTGLVSLSTVQAGDDISIAAANDHSLSLIAASIGSSGIDGEADGHNMVFTGGIVTLGAADAASITGPNTLKFNGATGTALIIAYNGDAAVNLSAMDAAISIGAAGTVQAQVNTGDLQLGTIQGNNVSLRSLLGAVDATGVSVNGNYGLAGASFSNAALQPGGARAGTWTITTPNALDLGAQSLVYNGDISLDIGGLLGNGTLQSVNGAISGRADSVDLYELLAGDRIDVTADNGSFLAFHLASDTGDVTLHAAAIGISGSVEAGGSISLTGSNGSVAIGHATAGGDLTLDANNGDAILRQATLTGATGDLKLASSTGKAVLGVDDYPDIGSDNYFERATGSIGSAHIWGTTGAFVNLDHSASLTQVAAAGGADVSVVNGALAIDLLSATSGDARAYTGNGGLTVNAVSGTVVDLEASGGDLTLGSGGITGADISLYSDRTIDTRATPVSAGHYLYIGGGSVLADTLHSGTDMEVYSAGIVTASALTAVGDATVRASGAFNVGRIAVHGGQFTAESATVRSITASDGFALVAGGNITIGADAGQTADATNFVSTGGTLAGCGCGSGGGTLVALGGDISVNLLNLTGVFDGIGAGGNVDVRLAQGDLGIHSLTGHDITVAASGVLTIMDARSAGGSYTLTAADFAGNALNPVSIGGASGLGNVTIIDTLGDLNSAAGALVSSGNIHVEAQHGAINGGLSLTSLNGAITVIGQGVSAGTIFGQDVTIDAHTGTAAVTALSVSHDYTLTAGDFAGQTLIPSDAAAGSLTITDTVGDFDFGSIGYAFGGTISITAQQGALHVGNLQAESGITLRAAGDLSLASARLMGAGANTLSLAATGDLVVGGADAGSITPNNVFVNNGSSLTGTIHADGDVAINLDRADALGAIDGGTVRIAIASGDLVTGDVRSAGAILVAGAGAVTLGDVATSAGTIGITSHGAMSLGNVSGHFLVDLDAGTGALTASGIAAGTLSVAASGTANLDHNGSGSHVAALGNVTVGSGDFVLRNLQDLSLNGVVTVNGLVNLQVNGTLIQNAGHIAADRLQGSVTAVTMLGADNQIDALGSFSSTGLKLNNATALAIDGAVQGNGGAVIIASHGGMTITANGSITSAAAGDAITLASDGVFGNFGGAAALSAANGRWLIYSQVAGNPNASDPANYFGGLAGASYYGDAFDFTAGSLATTANAGNRFVYGYRPVLTVTPNSGHVTYNGAVQDLGFSVTGLVNGDSEADAWAGAAALSGTSRNAGSHTLIASLGTLASDMNYGFAFGSGQLVVDPLAITAALVADSRTYNGNTDATGHLTLTGVLGSDQVSANGSYSFDDRNAGIGHVVTANGITLSGADAANYSVNPSATGLADILARAITAMLTVDDRTYDGTTAATGTVALNGAIAGDNVGANALGILFDSKNVGTRTATASGITLSGRDAGNYVLDNNSATALADILAKAITATLTANDRTYDGTTAATGTLGLSGVIGNDQVGVSGSLAFDNKNAGVGHIVTASGIALSGGDAGNYTVNFSATDLADILAKAITATLSANHRTYDGTTAATGTLALNGVVTGDSVAANAGTLTFDSRNVGTDRTVSAGGITLSGSDAGNYTVNATATDLANILAKAVTATLAANGRVYDGTRAATGSFTLSGLVAGDHVGVSASGIAFDSKNAGDRTATASGISLNGADAGNYTVNGTATGAATITQRAITATATADSRAYDGTTAATGRVALSGVIAGDTVTGTATYRFADANAGTARAVQVSGLALSGADAANYSASLSAAPVTADITRRAVTVTVNGASKILGQPDPALGYKITSGSLVNGDSFTGALARDAGELAGSYAIGQGTLALSANYLLTVIPGTLLISFTQSGAEANDTLKSLRGNVGVSFSLTQDPSRNLEGDGERKEGADGQQ